MPETSEGRSSSPHLDAGEVDDFWRDGFCLVPPFIPSDLLARANDHVDAVVAGEYETGVAPLAIYDAGGDHPQLVKIDEAHYADDTLAELVTHRAVGEWASTIFGAREVWVWATQLLIKPPSGANSANVGWHQDDDYWINWWDGEVFTCWIALSDVPPESGPVRFVRGSHRWGFLDRGNFFRGELDSLKSDYPVPEGERWEEVAGVMKPGAASFHHRHTVHGSGPNHSHRDRRSIAVHLRTEKAEPRPGSAYRAATDGYPRQELRIDTGT